MSATAHERSLIIEACRFYNEITKTTILINNIMNNKQGTLIFTELIVGKSLISPLTVAMVLGLANLHVMIIGKPAVKQCCAGALSARAHERGFTAGMWVGLNCGDERLSCELCR